MSVGLNQSRDQRQPDSQISLTNRIVLSAFAAKQLATFFKRGTVTSPEE